MLLFKTNKNICIVVNYILQDPYDPDEFVERLAYRVYGNSADSDNAVVDDVQDTFVQAIKYYTWIYL